MLRDKLAKEAKESELSKKKPSSITNFFGKGPSTNNNKSEYNQDKDHKYWWVKSAQHFPRSI